MKSLVRGLFAVLTVMIPAVEVTAVNPFATNYPWEDCRGSAALYPVPHRTAVYPDSLTPVMINHVGRHGARYPASPSHLNAVVKALDRAASAGTITPAGRRLQRLAGRVTAAVDGRWGELDSTGVYEQRGIAARMYAEFPELFEKGRVEAASSYVPRCVMSMYEFCHEISQCCPKVEIATKSGPSLNGLLRFFDSKKYKTTVRSAAYKGLLDSMMRRTVTMEPLRRVLGRDYVFGSDSVALALDEYSMLAGLEAMGMAVGISEWFSPEEYNSLWAAFNLKQYVDRTSTTLSSTPADVAAPLLDNLIVTTDRFIAGDESVATVNLRFGHAETLMPLLSLMRLRGCYYLTHNYESVALNWMDFNVVPMAANLRLILFRSDSGRYYVRVDHNEVPLPLLPGSSDVIVPWNTARVYLISLLPADM